MNPDLWRLLLDLVLLIVVQMQITSVSDVLAEGGATSSERPNPGSSAVTLTTR